MSKKKGGKKSKINVEEVERLVVEAKKAEEAERRRQEQELEAIRVKEAALAKAQAEVEALEKQTLAAQRAGDENFLQDRCERIYNINKQVAKVEDWEKWVAAIAMPDIDKLSALNTYLTSALDKTFVEMVQSVPQQRSVFVDPIERDEDIYPMASAIDELGGLEPPSVDETLGDRIVDEADVVMQKYLDECYMNEQVISLLTSIRGKAMEDQDERKLQWCTEYINQLRNITNKKLDQFTLSYLHYADDVKRTEEQAKNCLVENSAACPRDMTVEAGPPFDDLPGLNNRKKDVNPLEKSGSMFLLDTKDEEEEEEFKGNTKVIKYPEALPGADIPEMYFGIWVHNHPDTKVRSIEFSNMSFQITKLPYQLQQTRTCIRVIHTSYDHITTRPPPEDKPSTKKKKRYKGKRFVSVGGIINIEQLNMPLPPKPQKGWCMREHTSLTEELSVQPYPTTVEGSSSSSEQTLPLEISYQIPKFVLLRGEQPQFGWWNDKTNLWEEEGVEGEGYDPETRTAQLQLKTLRPFAVIQPRALDFPYRSWSINPVDQETARITVTGSRFDVQLELVRGKCRLLQPCDPVLAPIHNKLMDPGTLLLKLARTGINLIPSDDDAKFCRKPNKSRLEPMLHEQISMCATMFEVTGSTWNSSRGLSKSMFKIKLADRPAFSTVEANEDSVYTPEMVKQESKQNDDEDEDKMYDSDSDCGEVFSEKAFPEWLQMLCEQSEEGNASKFCITQSTDKKYDGQVFEGQAQHTSLRRCMATYYNQKDVMDKTQVDVQQSFVKADQMQSVLALQQTIHKTLNLLRVFTFH